MYLTKALNDKLQNHLLGSYDCIGYEIDSNFDSFLIYIIIYFVIFILFSRQEYKVVLINMRNDFFYFKKILQDVQYGIILM